MGDKTLGLKWYISRNVLHCEGPYEDQVCFLVEYSHATCPGKVDAYKVTLEWPSS